MGASYRKYLLDALAERRANNAGYSLRAFARRLGYSPSHLSRVLKGTKNISPAAARRIATRLKMARSEMEHFLDLAGWETSEGRVKELLERRLGKSAPALRRRKLRAEAFRLIADWYHLPLLELAGTTEFKSDPHWIAGRLGISVARAKAAVELLVSLKLLTRAADGRLSQGDPAAVETTDDVPDAAIRAHHEQMSRLAALAVHGQPVSEREFQSLQFPMDERQIPRLKELVRDFAQRLENEFRSRDASEVYQVNLQFFRLTRSGRRPKGDQ